MPSVTPNAKCKLRLLKLERIKDWLLMEEEFLTNQERLRPQEERNQEDRTKVPFVLLILLLYFWLLDAGCFLPLLVQVLDTVVGRCRSFCGGSYPVDGSKPRLV